MTFYKISIKVYVEKPPVLEQAFKAYLCLFIWKKKKKELQEYVTTEKCIDSLLKKEKKKSLPTAEQLIHSI